MTPIDMPVIEVTLNNAVGYNPKRIAKNNEAHPTNNIFSE